MRSVDWNGKRQKGESEKLREWGEGERNKSKILDTWSIVAVHICTVTITNVQIYTLLETLMLSIFEVKYVKMISFSVIHNFTSTDVDALN